MTGLYNPPTPPAARTATLSVVSHGQAALVEQLLGDLARLRPAALDRVVITRNLPEAPILVPASLHVPVTVVDNPSPKGFGANHNAAFAHCSSDWFVIVNPDIRLPADPFPALLAGHGADVGLVAPRVLEADGRPADAARVLPTPPRLAARRLRGRPTGPDAAPAWLAGMFLAVRHAAYAAVGGFDARYRLYCEDVDLCARLRLAGWRLVIAEGAIAVHDARRASRRSARHLGWHLASLARLWRSPAFWRYRALLARGGRGVERAPAR